MQSEVEWLTWPLWVVILQGMSMWCVERGCEKTMSKWTMRWWRRKSRRGEVRKSRIDERKTGKETWQEEVTK